MPARRARCACWNSSRQPRRYAVGLREGCMLRYENGRLELLGSRPMRIFKKGLTPYEVQPGDDLSFLL